MLVIQESLLRSLERCTSSILLHQLHAQVIAHGLNHDNYVAVKLISFCSRTLGDIVYARKIFDNLVTSANVFLWTTIITAYSKCQSEATREAVWIYKMMHRQGIPPNHFTLSSVLKACSHLKAIEEGNQIHAHSTKHGFNSSIYIQATLIDMYAKIGWVKEATQLYKYFPHHNVVSFNAMITCYAKSGDMKAADEVFCRMPDRDSISWNIMISGYADHGDMITARELFNQMPSRNVNSWNALIAGCCHNGEWYEAIKLLKDMCLGPFKPNHVSMSMLMSACGHLGALEIAKQLHGFLMKRSIEMNCHVSNSLVDMYAKCGNVDEAYRAFSEIYIKDVVSYNVMITAFASHGRSKDVLKIFPEMMKGGILPDTVTFLGILTACSHEGLVNIGCAYFDCMSRTYAIQPSADHYACMVDLYGRTGRIKEAYDLAKNMTVAPHAGVWGALLNACRKHGYIEIGEVAAQELFRIEPENPGNYVLLSNMYARAHSWDGVVDVRRQMRGNHVSKTVGCSWIEVNGSVFEFLTGNTAYSYWEGIYQTLRHLPMQLAYEGQILDEEILSK